MTEQNKDWVAVCMSHGTILNETIDKRDAELTAERHKRDFGCKIVIVGQKV